VKKIVFPRVVAARGRGGIVRVKGLEVLGSDGSRNAMLSPITSKGNVSESCWLEVPRESLDEVIAALTEMRDNRGEETGSG
jgi:RNase P/RNase MRP subunit POP5